MWFVNELWTAKQAADYLGLSIRTLEDWRKTHKGPEFIRIGRSIRYQSSVVTGWAVDQNQSHTDGRSIFLRPGKTHTMMEPEIGPVDWSGNVCRNWA
jgi:hypothetical protein